MRQPPRHNGFSLIELTLAMAMAAMLALSLYTAMNVAQRARRSAVAAGEPMRLATIAADIVRQDLDNAQPPTGTLAGPFVGMHETAPNGNADTLEFYALGADQPPTDEQFSEGMRKIEIYVQTDVQPPVLVRRVTRNLLASSEAPVEEEVLCRDVRTFSLRYFDGIAWQETWDSTLTDNVLPMAISLTIQVGGSASAPPQAVTRVLALSCARLSDAVSAMGVSP
jgi:type II secretion system protein J